MCFTFTVLKTFFLFIQNVKDIYEGTISLHASNVEVLVSGIKEIYDATEVEASREC